MFKNDAQCGIGRGHFFVTPRFSGEFCQLPQIEERCAMAIEWDESLRLGHATIDIQHMEIFAQINSLSDKITEGADDIEIRNLLNFLNTYAKKHFFDEEKLMVESNYRGIYKQKKQHTQFRNEIDELCLMLRKKVEPFELAQRIETALLRYFINHVSELDREFADFINFQNKGN
jgi:hemerythrin